MAPTLHPGQGPWPAGAAGEVEDAADVGVAVDGVALAHGGHDERGVQGVEVGAEGLGEAAHADVLVGGLVGADEGAGHLDDVEVVVGGGGQVTDELGDGARSDGGDAVAVTHELGQERGALVAEGLPQRGRPGASGADKAHVEQAEALDEGVEEAGVALARVVDLDAHEAAMLGVGEELGDGGARDVEALGDLALGQAGVLELGGVERLGVLGSEPGVVVIHACSPSPLRHGGPRLRDWRMVSGESRGAWEIRPGDGPL